MKRTKCTKMSQFFLIRHVLLARGTDCSSLFKFIFLSSMCHNIYHRFHYCTSIYLLDLCVAYSFRYCVRTFHSCYFFFFFFPPLWSSSQLLLQFNVWCSFPALHSTTHITINISNYYWRHYIRTFLFTTGYIITIFIRCQNWKRRQWMNILFLKFLDME